MRRLTGRINFRRTVFGRIVLQVEEEKALRWVFWREPPLRRRWRDAGVLDLTKVEMRPLIDLRNRPWDVPAPPSMNAAPSRETRVQAELVRLPDRLANRAEELDNNQGLTR